MKHLIHASLFGAHFLFAWRAFGAPFTEPKWTQSATRAECHDFVELRLQLPSPPPSNPFTEAAFSGEFGPEGGALTKVQGFCDSEDGSVFRIRFMPNRTGRHVYETVLRWGPLEAKHTGSFLARAGKKKGIVRVDSEHPTHFVWSGTGEHFFWNSTTTYWLLGNRDDRVIRESIDRLAKLKINRVRVALNARTYGGMRWKEPMVVSDDSFQFRLEPWRAAYPEDIENPGYDVSRFNVEHFRKAERMLKHARARDLIVSLIFHLDGADKGVDPFGKSTMGGPEEQRYYRYCVARFSAFANIMWDVTNEWHLFRDEPWVEKMGALIKDADPCGHLVSVHGTTRFPFGRSTWVDYVMFQNWDEHGAYDFISKARKEQAGTGRPMPIINEEYGYEDHYPYPWGEKRIWPARIGESRVRLAWEMVMAGGYQTTGERANVAGMGGWITGRGNNEMNMLYGYARMRQFFESFPWWKLEPHPELVTGESKALPVMEKGAAITAALCLAESGERYVIYLRAGGTASVALEPGEYRVRRFNPRSGETRDLPKVTGAERWNSPAMPDTENWVLLIERIKHLSQSSDNTIRTARDSEAHISGG